MSNFFRHLDNIRGDAKAVEATKALLNREVVDLSKKIKRRLDPSIVPGLIWSLALKELDRVSDLLNIPLSNFAGQARYLRALCASVPFTLAEPNQDPKTDELLSTCEELWLALFHRDMVDDLAWGSVHSAKRQQRTVAAITSLLNAIQGELRFAGQAEDRVRRLFSPFRDEIVSLIGLGPEEVVAAFAEIRNVLENRLEASSNAMQPMRDLFTAYEKRRAEGCDEESLKNFVESHPLREVAGQKYADGSNSILALLVFSPDDLKDLSKEAGEAFFEAFSFQPGEVNKHVETPTDEDVVRQRPFAKVGDRRYLLFDPVYCSFASEYRLIECFDTEAKKDRLNRRRDRSLEDEGLKLFRAAVKPGMVAKNYFIPAAAGGFTERDILLHCGDKVFVVECKARPLRSLTQRQDKLQRVATDVRRTIQEGYDQACDVIRYLKSTPIAPLFDSDKLSQKVTDRIDSSTIRHFIPIVLLDSRFGLIASDLEPWMEVSADIGYPWVVNRDTLEAIALVINGAKEFGEFVEWRRELHGKVFNEDENVIAGFFVRHGASPMPPTASIVQLDEHYADVIDAHYMREHGIPVEMPPTERTPPVWASMKRQGDRIVFRADGKVVDSIDVFGPTTGESTPVTPRGRQHKVGRNDRCPCGSGLKYKRCCLLKQR